MDSINILVVVSSVVFIFLLWLIVGFRHFSHLKKSISAQWKTVNFGLKKRQNMIPLLIEILKGYKKDQNVLVATLIEQRLKAAKEYEASAVKIEYEHDLSKSINRVFFLAMIVQDLLKDTAFLEIRSDINRLEDEIDEDSNEYNKLVMTYNSNRDILFLRPLVAMFGFGVVDIFEFEK
jgi:LemA protein